MNQKENARLTLSMWVDWVKKPKISEEKKLNYIWAESARIWHGVIRKKQHKANSSPEPYIHCISKTTSLLPLLATAELYSPFMVRGWSQPWLGRYSLHQHLRAFQAITSVTDAVDRTKTLPHTPSCSNIPKYPEVTAHIDVNRTDHMS